MGYVSMKRLPKRHFLVLKRKALLFYMSASTVIVKTGLGIFNKLYLIEINVKNSSSFFIKGGIRNQIKKVSTKLAFIFLLILCGPSLVLADVDWPTRGALCQHLRVANKVLEKIYINSI